MNPILKWAGSKRYLASTLIPDFPPHFGKYIEPFCGSASLYFVLEPRAAVLGDLNGQLINALSRIRDDPIGVAEAVAWLPTGEDDYYFIRALEPERLDPCEQAARFLYLNRYCFNGLFRTNRKGQFNVPYGSKPKLPADDEVTYLAAATLLHTAELLVHDFAEVCEFACSGDFVYLDPPYASASGRTFTEYGQETFNVDDLGRLEQTLKSLDRRGAYFMLSYADGPDIQPISRQWSVHTVRVQRNIAGFAGHRKRASEVVIRNY